MDKKVLAFAQGLQAHARELLDGDADVDWQTSLEPVPYLDAAGAMEKRAAAIAEGMKRELIWFLEHPSLYTAGTSAKEKDLLLPDALPVYRTGRGGQFTYHGPGQLVAYVLLDLNKRGRDVRAHVRRLENWIIAVLRDYGVTGTRRDGVPGVWIKDHGRGSDLQSADAAKIAAIGVRVRRWITFHGASINIDLDLKHYEGIVACGMAGAGTASLAKALQSIAALNQKRTHS